VYEDLLVLRRKYYGWKCRRAFGVILSWSAFLYNSEWDLLVANRGTFVANLAKLSHEKWFGKKALSSNVEYIKNMANYY